MAQTTKAHPAKIGTIGQPTGRDLLVDRLKDLCQVATLNPAVAPVAVGLSIALGMVQKQGEQSLRDFVQEIFEDVKTIKMQVNADRMNDPGYLATMVRVFKAVQFELQEEKRRCYRAVLLNSLTEEIGRHPEAQREFMLSLLEGLSLYAIMALRILNDPQGVNAEYNEILAKTGKPRPNPVTLWEVMFVFANRQIEQPTFGAVLADLGSKRLIELGGTSPDNLLRAHLLLDTKRVITDFGREFMRFITLPVSNA